MTREPRVCYYPVFTRSEALELQQKALAVSKSVEQYIRTRCGMASDLPDVHTPSGRGPGRPPLPPEELLKREAWRGTLTKLRRFMAVDPIGNVDRNVRSKYYAAHEMLRRHQEGIEEFTWEGFSKMVELAVVYPKRLHEAPPTKDWPRNSALPPPFNENPLRDNLVSPPSSVFDAKVNRRRTKKRLA